MKSSIPNFWSTNNDESFYFYFFLSQVATLKEQNILHWNVILANESEERKEISTTLYYVDVDILGFSIIKLGPFFKQMIKNCKFRLFFFGGL